MGQAQKGKLIAVETDPRWNGEPKPKRKKREFAMLTRTQFALICTSPHRGIVLVVFLHLKFLIFRSHTKSVRLTNIALANCNVGREGKRTALLELERLGLIQVTRFRHRSPQVTIVDPLKKTHKV